MKTTVVTRAFSPMLSMIACRLAARNHLRVLSSYIAGPGVNARAFSLFAYDNGFNLRLQVHQAEGFLLAATLRLIDAGSSRGAELRRIARP